MHLDYINLELTAHCGYHCVGCPNTYMRRPKGHMAADAAIRLIKEAATLAKTVYLWNYGEPLLHPSLTTILHGAGSDAASCVISTTAGTCLPSLDLTSFRGLRELVVSINGLDPETYQLHQKGGSFTRVLENLQALRGALTGSSVDYVLQFVVHDLNTHQIDMVPAFASAHGFKRAVLKTFNVMDEKSETYARFVPKQREHSRYHGSSCESAFSRRPDNPPCLKSLVVNWDGCIVPCCWDYEGDLQLGNVFPDGLQALWQSARFQSHLKSMEKREFYSFCHRCTLPRRLRSVPVPDHAAAQVVA